MRESDRETDVYHPKLVIIPAQMRKLCQPEKEDETATACSHQAAEGSSYRTRSVEAREYGVENVLVQPGKERRSDTHGGARLGSAHRGG